MMLHSGRFFTLFNILLFSLNLASKLNLMLYFSTIFVVNWKSIMKLYLMVFELYVFHKKSVNTALKMLKDFHRKAKDNIDQNRKEVGRDTNSI